MPPLYMDIHTVDSETFSAEDVVKAHMEDLSIQDRFGVKQIKYWVNVPEKTIFCLMAGPDKESCHLVHKESHGQTACNIIEVNDDEFRLFLGDGVKDEGDLAHTTSGALDTGYRTIIAVHTVALPGAAMSSAQIDALIQDHDGKIIPLPNERMASFPADGKALSCLNAIDELLIKDAKIDYTLVALTGKPVDEFGSTLFEETKDRLRFLSLIGKERQIFLDDSSLDIGRRLNEPELRNALQLGNEALSFLDELSSILTAESFSDSSGEALHDRMGMSKSMFYRNLKAYTESSPNQLVLEFRLKKAVALILSGGLNMSQISYSVGFNDPAYFTRVFKKRFGITPKQFAQQNPAG